jgi:MotA/TolQ/ExbB proton channel family
MATDTTRWRLFANPTNAETAGAALDVHAQQAKIMAAFKPIKPYAFDYLLLFRYGLVNLAAFALMIAAYFQGWIDAVREADPTHQCTAIAGVFLAGLFICTMQIIRISAELNQAHAARPAPKSRAAQYFGQINGRGAESRSMLAGVLKAKLMARTAIVRHIAGTLVILGLIGTVVGFIISLSGVNANGVADAKAISPMISKLILGMSVALYTTLVGAVLNIWLMVCYHVLVSGTMRLVTAIIERGELDGHA